MPKPSSGNLRVSCPCCGTVLHLDPSTGAILTEERPRKGTVKSLEEAVQEEAARRKQAKEHLDQAMEQRRRKDEIFEKKFKEALKKAEKDDSPPPRPFDLD